MGVADYVLESISGDLSRRMLEHYWTSASTRSARRSMRWTTCGEATTPQTATATEAGK